MNRFWGLVFAIVGLFVSSPAWADRDTAQYSSLTVFGDSLVDAGNYYIATKGVNPLPGLPYPDPTVGYFNGRLTNGYDYTDLLSIELFGTPTKPYLAGGSNFAFAAATLVTNGDPVPDLAAQLFLWQTSGQAVDPNGLYVLNFGANDLFTLLGVFGPPPADPAAYLLAAAQQYAAGIQALIDAGVRNLLVTDFPVIGNPYTDLANADLAAALAGLSLHPDTDLMYYSVSSLNAHIAADPAAFGLPPLNTQVSCIAAQAQASGCAGYFTFDGVHPTAALQAVAYSDMNASFDLTGSVPEPATWAMMLVGFGMIGAAMRYRRRPARIALA